MTRLESTPSYASAPQHEPRDVLDKPGTFPWEPSASNQILAAAQGQAPGGALEAPPGATMQEQLAAQAAQAALPTRLASDVSTAITQFTEALRGAMNAALSASASGHADAHAAARTMQDKAEKAWHNVHAGITGHIDSRQHAEETIAAVRAQTPQALKPTQPSTPWFSGDFLRDASNFFAAWGDTLSFGLTSRLRGGLGSTRSIMTPAPTPRAAPSVRSTSR